MNNYTVDILTPAKIVAQDVPAESLLVPTVAGAINILKDHTHVVSKLEMGIITIFGGAEDPERYFTVASGVCKILDNKVTVLATTAEEDKEVDVERAKVALRNAEEKLYYSDEMEDEEIEKYQRKVERARLRLQLVSYRG